MALKYILAFLLACANSTPLDPPPVEPAVIPSPRATEYRLPEGAVEVIHYDISLDVLDSTFEESLEFDGVATITFTSLITTSQIKLHSDLRISELSLRSLSGVAIAIGIQDYTSDNLTHVLTLPTSTQLISGTTYVLNFVYVATLRTDMSGFYRSTYIDESGNERILGATQFQPTHARKVFPCFDEPLFKAEFDIKIRHPRRYTAIGNTVGISVTDPNNAAYTTTTFARTPKMPTYLIAFIVSDFTCSQSDHLIEPNIPTYICSRPEALPTRELARAYAPNITWGIEEFTGVLYSTSLLTKIHHFAIPDFSAGAMENWGLITYRERILLWDPQDSSNRNKQNVITIVAHELAHFWFGNLVTTHWWSDTFLNEGFATYFEYHTPQEIDPSLELDKQFNIEQLQPVLVSDASPNSAPLSSPASSPGEISGRFSSISYNKGGSILRMVEHFIGTENFKSGLKRYLTDNQFGNTVPTDLWAALQGSVQVADLPSGRNLAAVMENWVLKPGYPVLNVTTSGADVKIIQKRYLSSGEPGADEQWFVPVSYTTSSQGNKFQTTKPNTWLLPNAELTIPQVLQNESSWIILNNKQIGYYRVDYDAQLWNKIKAALNKPGFDGIHELNRAQLADDFFNFARYGRKSWSELLDFYQFLRKDTSYYSWYAALNAFSFMTQRTTDEVITRALRTYMSELSEVVYSSLPFNEAKDDDQIYSLKKVLIIPWACRIGLQNCIDHAVDAFNDYKTTRIKPDKNLRATIYCNGLRYSRNAQTAVNDFNFLWSEFQTTKLSTEQVTILSALGCAKDEQVIKNYLSKSIDPNSGIREQDASTVFSSVYTNNPDGVDVAFEFLTEHYEAIANYYGSMNGLISIFSGLASRFTRRDQIDKLRQFIEDVDLGDAEPSAIASLNSAVTNVDWIETFEKELTLHFVPPEQTGGSAALTTGLATIITTLFIFFTNF